MEKEEEEEEEEEEKKREREKERERHAHFKNEFEPKCISTLNDKIDCILHCEKNLTFVNII